MRPASLDRALRYYESSFGALAFDPHFSSVPPNHDDDIITDKECQTQPLLVDPSIFRCQHGLTRTKRDFEHNISTAGKIFKHRFSRRIPSETIVLVRVTSSFGKNRNKKAMIGIRVFEKLAATALMLALLNGGDRATGFSATSLTGCPRAASTAASSLTQLPTQMSSGLFAFQNEDVLDDTSTTTTSNVCSSRGQFLKGIMMFTASTLALGTSHVEPSYAKSYSSNARNMERLNSGDASGGSVYNNNPTSEAGKKRRAMTGCKSSTAREEAAENVLKVKSLSEYECNQIVMNDGETEFMLSSLRKLECPTCPYGISSSREKKQMSDRFLKFVYG